MMSNKRRFGSGGQVIPTNVKTSHLKIFQYFFSSVSGTVVYPNLEIPPSLEFPFPIAHDSSRLLTTQNLKLNEC